MVVSPVGPFGRRQAGAGARHYNIRGRISPRRLPGGRRPAMRRNQSSDLAAAVLRFAADPARNWPIGLALLVVILIVWWTNHPTGRVLPRDGSPSEVVAPGEYLFCFWNVENLFDDREGQRPPD